jgi:hypothetical protein
MNSPPPRSSERLSLVKGLAGVERHVVDAGRGALAAVAIAKGGDFGAILVAEATRVDFDLVARLRFFQLDKPVERKSGYCRCWFCQRV